MTDYDPLDALGKLPEVNLDDALGALDDLPELDLRLPGETEEVPDPLENVDYSGDLEQDSAAELTALEQGYRDRAAREADRFRLATDSEYWFAVCFRTREEKERFLKAAGLYKHGDKYLDGDFVARKLGIVIDQNG